jgi:hypothetical protein
MSMEDLHEIVAQLHKFAEEGGAHRAPTLQETHLLFKTALHAVHELESLERRVAALEDKAPKGLSGGGQTAPAGFPESARGGVAAVQDQRRASRIGGRAILRVRHD